MAFTIAELAKLSLAAYDNPPKNTAAWQFVQYFGTLGQNRFFAALFAEEKNEHHVLAIRGTDGMNDVVDDLAIFAGTISQQMLAARAALAAARQRVQQTKRLVLTGHSLGGGLAALLAAQTGLHCVTFNAPGTARAYGELFARQRFPVPIIQELLAVTAPMVVNTGRIINLRATWDMVSVGTGPRLGRVDSIAVRGCDPVTEFQQRQPSALRTYNSVKENKAPSQEAVTALTRGAGYVLCQHSMERMVNEIGYHPDYNRDLGW